MSSVIRRFSSPRDRSNIYLIFISVLLGIIYQSFQSLLPNNQSFNLILLSNATGYIGCLGFICSHRLPEVSRRFMQIVLYLFIIGLSYGTILNKDFLTTALVQDFRYIMYFMAGCVFSYSQEYMKCFHYIMKVISIIAIGLGIYALLFFDYSYVSIETRGSTWSLSYMFWWTAGACWVYWLYYALFVKQEKIFAIGPTLIYVLLGILFLKREVIVNTAVILFVFLLFNKKHINTVVKTLFYIFILVIIVYQVAPGLFSNVFGLLFERFSAVEDIAEFDRQIESNLYFSEATPRQIILGNGLGHYHIFQDDEFAMVRGILNSHHLGYTNILYKGGIAYVFFYLYLLAKVFKKYRRRGISPYMKVCVGVSFSYFASLFYAGSWTYTIAPFCIAAPLFYAAGPNTD